jgi:hypothetical protein
MFFQSEMCFLSKTFTTFVKSKFWGCGGGEQTLGMKSGDFGTFFLVNFHALMTKRNPVQPIQREFL